jgi:hypothetical protein
MRARKLGSWGVGTAAGLFALVAQASLVKSDGSPPVLMPNTLLVEAGERLEPGPAKTAPAKVARTVADSKQSPRTCAAVAVKIPDVGTRIVTARHCADHRLLEVLDDEHEVTPIAQIDAEGDVDLSMLEVAGKLPWSGLEIAPALAIPIGDRLCAWRMRRGTTGIARERICARLVRRQARPGADPLLVMNHPYPAGTSGSALVDREGRVVGIVVASTGMSGIAEPIEGVQKLRAPAKVAASLLGPLEK